MKTRPTHYDVIVIGAGPAGYVAAIRCAQLGLKTGCVDHWTGKGGLHSLGGTFLNAGCIPALTLLESAKLYQSIKHDSGKHGIGVFEPKLDIGKMIQHKDQVLKSLSDQIVSLFDANQIDCIFGTGQLLDGKVVEVHPNDGPDESYLLESDNVILATGSSSLDMDAARIDGDRIVDSYNAMNFTAVPKHLGIIGAGVIGLEHASIWARLGSKVTLFDAQDDFLGFVDQQLVDEALSVYSKQGMDIRFRARVTATKKSPKSVRIDYEDPDGAHQLRVDKLIVAVGRKPNSENLASAEADLLLDENGFVHVDEQCMTNLPGVYAVGDLVQGPMLAHKGAEEGIMAAEVISGKERSLRYSVIPNVIYTDPEIAWVGETEQHLRSTGEPIKIGIFPFSANACCQATGTAEGFVKIISQKHSDQILGVHIINPRASELIAEAVLAMEYSASTEDLARTVHAYPSLSKALHEAAMAIDNRALHIPPSPITSN